jgi:hypothetical protein
MSRQRPYGDFEEAYIDLMLNNAPKELDDFILYLIYASNVDSLSYRSNDNFLRFKGAIDYSYDEVHFPMVLYNSEYLHALWMCLCRMYGEVCGDHMLRRSLFRSYIPISNIKMALDDLRWYIDKLWPYYD